MISDGSSWANESDAHPSGSATDAGDLNDACKTAESEPEAGGLLHDQIKWPEQHVVKKVRFSFSFVFCGLGIVCLRICPLKFMP